jgi:Ca-activated chloride channel family protein
MFMGGIEVKGEILDKDRAARKYHDIVRRMKDPALLEYVGKNLFQARVYPIPARGDVKIRVFYQQVLPYDNGVTTYRFTSEDPKFYAAPIRDYRLSIDISSESSIKAVYSPTHQVEVDRPHDRAATVLLTRSDQKTTKDFILYYSVSKEEVGCNLLTYYDRHERQGYFLGLIAPDLKQKVDRYFRKNVLFVLDVSGSMAGEKIEQAKEALRFCLNSLQPEDMFAIVSYSDDVERNSDEMLRATRDNVRSAMRYVDALSAAGGTDINRALLEALSIDGAQSSADYVIFLTDGEPTVGETNPDRITHNIRAANGDSWKIFCFGVGYDVKAELLDRISEESGAIASYVRPNEDIEVKVSSFFAKIANPAMTDIKLVCEDTKLTQIYPRNLPDLFYGMQLVLAGRFDSPGRSVIRLEGYVDGKAAVFEYDVDFSDRSHTDKLVPRQWAIRRIGYLIEEIGHNPSNEELKQEIIRLSKEYGIATPYTSFFVEDPALADGPIILDQSQSGPIVAPSRDIMSMSKPTSNVVLQSDGGKARIDRSQVMEMLSGDNFAMHGAGSAQAAPPSSSAAHAYAPQTAIEEMVARQIDSKKLSRLVTIDDKTFQLVGETLVDSRYDGTQTVVKIQPFSEAYFRLLEVRPDLGAYLSHGGEILIVIGTAAVKICDDGADSMTDEILKLIG